MADAPFFVSGGTLPLSAGSYVERAADRALLDALSNGRYAYVLNARQMGKSSLCVRTIARLEAAGVRTAFVDLTRIGGRNVTPDQWYVGLLGEIGRAIGGRAELVRFWKENPDVSPMQRFFGALAAYALPEGAPPLVVFVDEVDATRSLPFSADEFFGGVRECFNRRAHDPAFARLTFCLLGAAIPSDLIRDMEASPFNVGERIPIRDFTKQEAMAFAAGLSDSPSPSGSSWGKGPGERGPGSPSPSGSSWRGGWGEREAQALVSRVFHWTAGHPFLTQSLCACLAETGAKSPADVDRLVEADLFAPSARESNVNLADVGNRVLLSPGGEDPDRHRAEILALYDRIRKGRRAEDDESNPRVAILKLSGLVVAEGGLLKVRNRIYARVFGPAWIAEHMPDGEARRVRRAYRVGLLRAAAAGAALLAVVGALGASAVGQAHRAEDALAQVEKERDRARVAERRANESALAATTAQTRAEGLATERIQALTIAKADRDRATASARLERIAREGAQAATGKERLARQDALASARRAVAAGEAERVAARRAQDAAAEAKEKTAVALTAGKRADVARKEAESLLYDSDLQLASVALAENNGVKAASILEGARAPNGRPSWVERHDRAVVDEGDAYPGHRDRVARVAFASDGDLLTLDGATFDGAAYQVVYGGNGTVRRWSTKDGRLVRSFSLADVPGGRSLDLAPDGMTVAVSTDGAIRLLSTDGFRLERSLNISGGLIDNLTLSSVSGHALGMQGARLREWDLATGRLVRELGTPARSPLYAPVSLFPNGDLLQFKPDGRHGLLRRGRLPDGTYRTKWSLSFGNSLWTKTISPDGSRIAFGDTFGSVELLDGDTGRVLGYVSGGARAGALAFSPDGQRLAIGSEEGTVRIVDANNGFAIATLPTRHPGISTLAFSPDGRSLAIGNADGTAVRRRLDDWTGASNARSLTGWNASVSGDGRLMAFAETRGAITLVDPRDGRLLRRLAYEGEAPCVALSADGGTVAAIDPVGHLRTWRATDGRPLVERTLSGPTSDGERELNGWVVGLSPDGRYAVAHYGRKNYYNYITLNSCWLLDLATPAAVKEIAQDGQGYVAESTFSPDGRSFVVLRQTGLLQAFRAGTWKPLWSASTLDKANGVAYSPDGRLLAVGLLNGRIEIEDAATGVRHRSWPAHEGEVRSVAFTADGGTLLSSGTDGALRSWDTRTWRSLGSEKIGGTSSIAVARRGIYFVVDQRLLARRDGSTPWVKSRPSVPQAPVGSGTASQDALDRSRVSGKAAPRRTALQRVTPPDSARPESPDAERAASSEAEAQKAYDDAFGAGRFEEALALAERINGGHVLVGSGDLDLRPLASKLYDEAAQSAREGRPKEAADRIVRTMRIAGRAPNEDYLELRFALVLYGVAGDLEGARAARDLIARDGNADNVAILSSLVPGVLDDPAALLRQTPNTENLIGRSDRALLAVRAGSLSEAEAIERDLLKSPQRQNDRAWDHRMLALVLAHEGHQEEARAELATAEIGAGAIASDADLLGQGNEYTTEFVLFRREILAMIGGEDPMLAARADYTRAFVLAQNGNPKQAAELLAGTMRRWGVDLPHLQFAMALYGIAGDQGGARAMRDLVARLPSDYTQAFLLGLVPGVDDEPAAHLVAPSAVRTFDREYYALATLRAKRYAEAEAELRGIIQDRATELVSNPVARRSAREYLALALAYQGKRDEARAELAASDIYGGASDEALLKRAEAGSTTFVLLRREILGLIGG